MVAEINLAAAGDAKRWEIEYRLLVDAIYQMYHYDFRGYAVASLNRRLRTAMLRFDCRSLSQLQDRLLNEPQFFGSLLNFLTVPVSEMFRDPTYFVQRTARQRWCPLLPDLSLAEDPGCGGLRFRGGGLFAGDPVA